MAKPPNVGTLALCALRPPGSSKRFFMTATLIIDGMARKVIIKAVIQQKQY